MQFKKLTKGYIYILSNSAYADDLLKIGMTTRTPEERARELYKEATGVPAPFVVSYKRSVVNCDAAEDAIHKRLQNFRSNSHREFFKISLDNAKKILDEVSELYSLDTSSEEEREREYWRYIVKTDKKELRGDELIHKIDLENVEFTVIGKGNSVLFPKGTVRLDDLKKCDKFIKQFLEEREREREKAYLEHQKMLAKKKKGIKGIIKLLYKMLTYP